jgi:hypothetical protein
MSIKDKKTEIRARTKIICNSGNPCSLAIFTMAPINANARALNSM